VISSTRNARSTTPSFPSLQEQGSSSVETFSDYPHRFSLNSVMNVVTVSIKSSASVRKLIGANISRQGTTIFLTHIRGSSGMFMYRSSSAACLILRKDWR
jgi:hypothetical protein